jgi:hypothetical protein
MFFFVDKVQKLQAKKHKQNLLLGFTCSAAPLLLNHTLQFRYGKDK